MEIEQVYGRGFAMREERDSWRAGDVWGLHLYEEYVNSLPPMYVGHPLARWQVLARDVLFAVSTLALAMTAGYVAAAAAWRLL